MNTDFPAIKHIFISQQHNFTGRKGEEPETFLAVDCPQVELRAGSGIVGDRYFDHKPDYKGQVTFFDWATFLRIRVAFPQVEMAPSIFRRNVITTGLDLNQLIGVEFEMQGIRFAGTEEARPCNWMNLVIGEGAKDALEGFGGLRARILNDGRLKIGPCDLRILEKT